MVMKKLINKSENLTNELLEGLELAFNDILELKGTNHKLVCNKKLFGAKRVGIVAIGGTGHEPALSGFVGEGMLDISVPGDVFAAPGPNDIVEAIKLAEQGCGVLLIVLNHAGDMLAGNMAMKEAKKQNLNVVKIVTQEDIAAAPRSDADNRRGLGGCAIVYKIAGSMAVAGKSLSEIVEVCTKVADNMASVGVALTSATHPANGMTLGEFADDEMEIGAGQHGEGGGNGVTKLLSADETIVKMSDLLIDDLTITKGENVIALVNGSGATTIMEQCICYRACHKYLTSLGINVVAGYAGNLLTVQERAGVQLIFGRVDETALKYWNAPCRTPYFNK